MQQEPATDLEADHEPPARFWDIHRLQDGFQTLCIFLECCQRGRAAVQDAALVCHLEAAGQVVDEGGLAQATLTYAQRKASMMQR